MDMFNNTQGTFLDNILKINEEISAKLKIKIDLTKENILNNNDDDGNINRQKAYF